MASTSMTTDQVTLKEIKKELEGDVNITVYITYVIHIVDIERKNRRVSFYVFLHMLLLPF